MGAGICPVDTKMIKIHNLPLTKRPPGLPPRMLGMFTFNSI